MLHPGKARAEGRTVRLASQMVELANPGQLLPTPLANEGEKAWIGKRESKGQKYLSHIIGEKLLPTPNTMDMLPAREGEAMERQLRRGEGEQASRRSTMGNLREDILQTADPDVFKRELLPTPKATDGIMGTPMTTGRPVEKSTHLGTIAMLQDVHLEHRRENVQAGTADRSEPAWGAYEQAIRRWEAVNGEVPPPTELTANGKHRLNAGFAEWMMGLPPGWVTDVEISRNDQLKAIGNGVVPQQAILALTDMLQATSNGGFFSAEKSMP